MTSNSEFHILLLTNKKCNTFTPKIKGTCSATYKSHIDLHTVHYNYNALW